MKKLCVVIFTLFVSSTLIYGQEYPHDFGKISQAEMDMKLYEKDTTAEAVVLYDIGLTHFYQDARDLIRMAFERRTRIKILKKSGIDGANIVIQYYVSGGEAESVTDIEACSYNLQDKRLQTSNLAPKDIFDEKRSSGVRVKKFAIPDVKVGSVIEIKYKITSPFFVYLRDWNFQWTIPVIYSEYVARLIPLYEYSFLLQGAPGFDSYTAHGEEGEVTNNHPDVTGTSSSSKYIDMVHKFIMKNVPAFQDRAFITTDDDYLIKVHFQLTKILHASGATENYLSTWPDISDKLLDLNEFGKYINNSNKLTSKIQIPPNQGDTSLADRIDPLVNYVKSNYSWNGENSYFSSQSPNGFLKNKTGNSADINLFLVGLLNNKGFNAFPVILSTRENGKVRTNYPYLAFFNYVLAGVSDGKNQLLFDATSDFIPNDEIPIKCINDHALIITPHSNDWIDMSKVSYISSTDYMFKHQFGETAGISLVQENIVSRGQNAVNLRENYADEKSIIDEMAGKNKTIDSVKFLDHDTPDKPFIISFREMVPVNPVDGKIFISPFLDEPTSVNPFKTDKRTLPIDLIYVSIKKFTAEIQIPEGYKVIYRPGEYHVDNDLMYIDYRCVSEQNKVIVTGSYYFKRKTYQPFLYNTIKNYMNDIIKYFNDKVVITKSS